MSRLTEAIVFAASAHRGQTDKTGQPFIGHPLRVMAYVIEELEAGDNPELNAFIFTEVACAAVLHDTVEDAGVSLDAIRRNYGSVVAEAVDALSRREGETYRAYIERCAKNRIARFVKRYDIRDNSDPRRQWEGAPLGRYAWALEVLEGRVPA